MSGKTRHTVFSSDGWSLHLTTYEKLRYDEEHLKLVKKYAKLEFLRRGIWAGNQGVYVKSLEDLSDLDSVPKFVHEFILEGLVPGGERRDDG